MKPLKTHISTSCTNVINSWSDSEELKRRVVTDIRELTCGQCKGTLLNKLRNKDWKELTDEEVNVLCKYV